MSGLRRVVGTFAALSAALLFGAPLASAQTKPAPPAKEPELDLDALYDRGQQLFDTLAPAAVKEQYRFPTREEWNGFAAKFQQALENNDLAALAAYESQARTALQALVFFPELADYADWLEERADYAGAAKQALALPAPRPPAKPVAARPFVPYYDLWLARLKSRPAPPRAPALLSRVTAAFTAEGMPAALVWLAEAESTFNPAARSPVGAKGLFQLMPDTAKSLGLRTFLPDERADPEKNARAAARYLKQLHGRFGDWPLVLAAYNAGPGRVQRTLTAQRAKTFGEIAAALPSETRMYVPKVLATLRLRTGVEPGALPAPR